MSAMLDTSQQSQSNNNSPRSRRSRGSISRHSTASTVSGASAAPFRRAGSIDIHTHHSLFSRTSRLSSRGASDLSLVDSFGATTISSGFSNDLSSSNQNNHIHNNNNGNHHIHNMHHMMMNGHTSYTLSNREDTSHHNYADKGDGGSLSSLSTNNQKSTTTHRSTGTKWGNLSVKFSAQQFVSHQKLTSTTPSLTDVYELGDLLGEGGYGEVYACRHIESGQERAVKVIPKVLDNSKDNAEDAVMHEFNILKACDHPNLLKCYECLEDAHNYYIVSEIIKGGELYDELDRCGNLTEDDTRILMNVLLSCINYCHQRGLAHRDLKPENILLDENRDYHQLKIIDFGLARHQAPVVLSPEQPESNAQQQQFLQQQESPTLSLDNPSSMHSACSGAPYATRRESTAGIFTEIQGSKYYMAPQVVLGAYTKKCDIWASGVIAYVMLSGYAPFDGATDEEIYRAVLDGSFDFDDEAWDYVGDEAKDFVMTLLTYDEEARPSAEECLQHPWLHSVRQDLKTADHQRRASTQQSLNDLQQFHSTNSKLKQATCAIIASQFLSHDETEEIGHVFRSLDFAGHGKLKPEDLKRAYREVFDVDMSDDDIQEMIKQVNFSGSGAIEYSEFVIATMMEKNMVDDDKLRAAFHIFDKENKGYISAQNLKEVLHIDDTRAGDAYVTKKIIAQVNAKGDNRIDFEEFKNMMFSKTLRRTSVRRSSRIRLSLSKLKLDDLDELDGEEGGMGMSSNSHYNHLLEEDASSIVGSRRIRVGEALLEDSEEDHYSCSDSSATREEDLFGPGDDCIDVFPQQRVTEPPEKSEADRPKRRKARRSRSGGA